MPIRKQRPNRTKPDSECINSYYYNRQAQNLTIEFQKRGTYNYSGVPQSVADGLDAAGSKGSYFNSTIRPGFAGNRGAGPTPSNTGTGGRGRGRVNINNNPFLSSDENEGT